ncbi:FAD/NAD(P)-binding domain-containing protein [Atractiella rhizophila]|nr:FAD/NAD(P)-binding domain-containing protein [Atractiella rhizophila]
MANYKNVVVVGAGPTALETVGLLLKKLPSDHRIVLVEANDFAYWPLGSLRASVVPGWEDEIIVPLKLSKLISAPHILLAGTPVQTITDDEVILEAGVQGFESGRIPYAYLVIGTGSQYNAPCRPPKEAKSIEDVKAYLRGLQEEVKRAKSVLVVGGGPVGIEFAGEVRSRYPKKPITLVSAAKTLLSPSGMDEKPKLASNLADQLKKQDIDLVFNERLDISGLSTGLLDQGEIFTLTNGQTITADFVFLATGNKASVPILEGYRPDAVSKNGRAAVSPTLQLKGSNNIFVVGDATDVKELKTSPLIAANIVASIKSLPLKEYTPGPPQMAVTIGTKGGAGVLMGMTVGAFMIKNVKGGKLFVPMWTKSLKVDK